MRGDALTAIQVLQSLRQTALRAKVKLEETIGATVGQLYIDVAGDYRNTVFVAGSGRSGTTWIAELINFDNSYRLIFEPFNRVRVPLCRSLFSRVPYLSPEDNNLAFLKPVRTVLTGRLRDWWCDRFNRQPLPRKRLIKEIRANLWLRWLHSHFPEVPLILVLRHPGSVVASQLRRWSPNLTCLLEQEPLMSDFLSPFKAQLESATTPFEKFLFRWCIETYVPLRQFKPGQIHLAFYENFCVKPRLEVARLFAFLGRPLDERAFKILERPSKGNKLRSRTTLIRGWRRDLSDQQIRATQDALKLFGLESMYQEDGMPDVEAVLRLLSA